ncbi:MAG: DUF4838 domain-containing protein [Candidatus Omnitrophica bacterium]|nr:DUF4838 domain-containing protein [Candidatus Omnitrophota bacterium]
MKARFLPQLLVFSCFFLILNGSHAMTLGSLKGWDIVVPESAIPSEQYAAEEFKDLFKLCTGDDLTIRHASKPGSKAILIGSDLEKIKEQPLMDSQGLGDEGLRIQVSEDLIQIQGGKPRGVLYGVYEFFERYVGVRFLTYDHTHIPENAAEADIPVGEFTYVPPFSFRWPYYKENSDHPEFAAKMRCNTVTRDEKLGGVTPQELINHSLYRYINKEKFGETHPEYFALVDGERKLEMHGGGPEPCVTNPEVIEIVAKGVIEDLNNSPERRNISVSQNDNDAYCRCATCEAINQREGTPMGSHLALVNAVAERVEKVHPKVKIGTLAYWYTRQAPKTIKPRDNMQIQLCSIECCTLHPINDPHCKRNQKFCQDIDDWNAISKEIWIWNYNTDFSCYDLPFPNLRVIGPNLRFFRDNKVKGVFMQANGNGNSGEFCDLRNYVISRLLWNPDQRDDLLIREFCMLHYGKAAPPILAYIDLIHENAEKEGVHPGCFPTACEVGLNEEVVIRAMKLFEKALDLAENETVRNRVEKAMIPVYKAMIATHGNLKYREGKCYYDFPAGYEDTIPTYIELGRKHNLTQTSEHEAAEVFFKALEDFEDGLPAVQIENETWKLTLIPGNNARIIDLTYKPTDRNIVKGDRRFGRIRPFEEWGVQGYDHDEDPKFEATVEGQTIHLTKKLKDGTVLERTIALPDDGSGKVLFEGTAKYEGDGSKTLELKIHPEYDTVTRTEDAKELSVYVQDNGKWKLVNEEWDTDEGPSQDVINNAKGGSFAFFNHEAGYGVTETYNPDDFARPNLWWSPGRKLLNLELITPSVELKKGDSFSYSYEIEYTESPPDA